MLCSVNSSDTSWRARSWYSRSAISKKPRLIRSLGLLVKKIRRRTAFAFCRRGSNRIMFRISWLCSHSSKASITITEIWGCWLNWLRCSSGWRSSFLNCSLSDFDAMLGLLWSIFYTLDLSSEILRVSCFVNIGKNFFAFPRSPLPLLKKKVAPRWSVSLSNFATVRDIVDFPVPAIPFSQKMLFWDGETAHSIIC